MEDMKVERRLGRGLGTLLSSPGEPEVRQEVEIHRLRPNPYQPRRVFDDAALEELRDSIRRHGILQPIVVRRAGDGFEIVSGERRWRAARLAGLSRIPAIVREAVSDDQMLELALVENLQRADLDPIEKAKGFGRLQDRFGLTQEQVAERVGMRRSTVANHLRLLDLPSEVQDALAQGLLQMGHARALLGLPDAGAMVETLEQIVRRDLSVREVERLTQARREQKKGGRQASDSGKKPPQTPPWATEVERRLREHLGTQVRLEVDVRCTGRISIEIFGREDLERVLGVLGPSQTLGDGPEDGPEVASG